MHYYKFLFLFAALFLSSALNAQENTTDTLNNQIQLPDTLQLSPQDTLGAAGDSVKINVKDSLNQQKVAAQDSVGDIETTINYNAEDSILVNNQTRTLKLYGDAVVTYGEIKLEAAEIILDWNSNTVRASGRLDTADTWVGQPVFTEGGEIYETKQMTYNFDT
ncbi:MAG: hypothetical protein ACOCXH_08910, partial [Cyclobacteriaceae bacterium]